MDAFLIEECRSAMNSGECLRAYEIALSGLEQQAQETHVLTGTDRDKLEYLAVLALARMGATAQAKLAYAKYKLSDVATVDAGALEARIEKDIAINASEAKKSEHFLAAAQKYQDVFQAYGADDYYPAINAASMFHLAGKESQAIAMANKVLQLISDSADDYWSMASAAEANLLIGEKQKCIQLLTQALEHPNANLASTASTRGQFKLLTDDADVLAPLALPSIIHFAGHIISPPDKGGKFPADKEQEVEARVKQTLDELNVAIAYGALAAGADIIVAEQVLARGGELHVVMPFDEDDFIEVSVAPSGEQWVKRFKDCLAKASSCTFSSTGPYNDNNGLFHHCTVYAMGRACLRRQHLGAPITQVLVWNGDSNKGTAGTYSDKQTWQRLGYSSHIIPIDASLLEPGASSITEQSKPNNELSDNTKKLMFDPSLKAVLFGDVAGFSKLTDAQIPVFVSGVMGRLATALETTLEGSSDALLSVNTWGDGLFVVLNDARTAARCALAMQHAMQGLELSELDTLKYAQQPQLRIGAHFGPIFEFEDPMTKRPNYFGQHVNTAARIEPIAPQGEVYVTEAFAAHLALNPYSQFRADYVGEMELAKKYGKARMYLLRQLEH